MEFWFIREWDGTYSKVTAIKSVDGVRLLYAPPHTEDHLVSHAYFDSIKVYRFDPNVY